MTPYINRIHQLEEDLAAAEEELHDASGEISELTLQVNELTEALSEYQDGNLSLLCTSYLAFRTNEDVSNSQVQGTYFTIGVVFGTNSAYIYIAGSNVYNNDFDQAYSFSFIANPNVVTPVKAELVDKRELQTISFSTLPYSSGWKLCYAYTTNTFFSIFVDGFYNHNNDPCYVDYKLILNYSLHTTQLLISDELCPGSYNVAFTSYGDTNPYVQYQPT